MLGRVVGRVGDVSIKIPKMLAATPITTAATIATVIQTEFVFSPAGFEASCRAFCVLRAARASMAVMVFCCGSALFFLDGHHL